ncbi:MAG: Rrf2 family transcriptional regulator [Clostridia bacterium]|nr:Rrf2 family transcriptional regulator [Clostridia bacterium]
MRISTKARYGLASMIFMAMSDDSSLITVVSIAEKLGISKIYLEQIFSSLKKSELVASTKGSQGGYRLFKAASEITVFDILSCLDGILFEKTDSTVAENACHIEDAMNKAVFYPLDEAVENVLKKITLYDLANEAFKNKNADNIMYFI